MRVIQPSDKIGRMCERGLSEQGRWRVTQTRDSVCQACVGGPSWHARVSPQCRGLLPMWMRSEDGTRHQWLVAQVKLTVGGKVASKEAFIIALGFERTGKHKKRRTRWSAQQFFGCCRVNFDSEWGRSGGGRSKRCRRTSM